MYFPTLNKAFAALTLISLATAGRAVPEYTEGTRIPVSRVPDHFLANEPTAAVHTYIATHTPHPAPGETWETPYGPASLFAGYHEAHHNKTLSERTSYAGVYSCANRDFKGPCQYIIASGGKCHAFPFQNAVYPSFGPDHGLTCVISRWLGCGDNALVLRYPGVTDMTMTTYGTTPGSFKCHWT